MTEATLDATDLELVERARGGDQGAMVELWSRHYPAALATARQVTRQPRDAEEIAADAFTGMLSALAGGAGPVTSTRAYLVASVRNLAASRARHGSASEVITDDEYVLDAAQIDTSRDPVAECSELGLMRQAFAELPRRWQVVLWRTAVDRDSNVEVAVEMGLSPNGVAALARRARRGLRVAYLKAHVSTKGIDPACAPFLGQLPDLVTGDTVRDRELRDHVTACPRCTARVAELRAVDQRMGMLLGPALLGLAPSSWITAAGAAATGSSSAAPTTARGSHHVLRWLAASGATAGAVTGLLWAFHRGPVPEAPPVPVATTTAPAPAPRVPPTRPPATTRTSVPTPSPRTSRPPAAAPPVPPKPPAPPPSSPPPSTTTVVTTPLTLDLAVGGTATDTAITVGVGSQGIAGPLTLHLSLPAGVSLIGGTGDWTSCSQSGTTVTCSAAWRRDGRWSGTLHTQWPATTPGELTATVTGRYANGSAGTAGARATWPP